MLQSIVISLLSFGLGIRGPLLRIKTKAGSVDIFRRSFFSGIVKGSRFTEKTGWVPLNHVMNRNYYCGDIDDEYLWIMRPTMFYSGFQRIFYGKVIETAEGVEVVGRFAYPLRDRIWYTVFGVFASFAAFVVMVLLQVLPLWTVVLLSPICGLFFVGIATGVERLLSRACEKDVLRYLENTGTHAGTQWTVN